MAWAINFLDCTFDEKASFLYQYLKMRPSEERLQKVFRETLSFIVGGLYVCPQYRYISEGAKKLLNVKCSSDIPLPKKSTSRPASGITIEHTIPIRLTIDYLLNLNMNETTKDDLCIFLKKIAGCALITDDENKSLNKKLKDSLPEEKSIQDILNNKIPHECRYIVANIKVFKNDLF